VLREDFAAPVLRFGAVERLVADLPPAEARVEPEPLDFARLEPPFVPPVLAREVVERLAVERFAVEPDELLRAELDFRAPPLLLREREDDEPELDPSSLLHLPDITRCAASATASAISEPNLVALDIMLLAACEAVSAASRPASRILRRAEGLALIAAAAAARPAASISLLIAALASLSTVSDELDEDLEEEVFFVDFAIAYLPASRMKALQRRNGSRMNPEMRGIRIC
jgi:hypothetical protein